MTYVSMGAGLALAMMSTAVWAQTCPPAPDHAAALTGLFSQMSEVETEGAARDISNQLWALWTDAPDAAAQSLLDRGMRARSGYDFVAAYDAFDKLVAYCPEYAEGYNQRAFVSYLRQDFPAALKDLDLTLALSPRHVGALSGKALSLLALGQIDEARAALQSALALNPWLSERALLAPGGALAPPGQDL